VSFPFDLHSAAMSDSHLPCCDHALLRPCRSSLGHGTGRPSRDGLWATGPRSASSGYHAESHEVVIGSIPISDASGQCENKQLLSLTRKIVVAAHYKKDALINCWTSSSVISGYHADFHEGHGTVGTGQGRGMACVNSRTAWHGNGMGSARARHAMCESALNIA
jgi:hypothetical protein